MKYIILPNMPRMNGRHYCIAKSLVESGHEVHYVMWDLPYTLPPKKMLRHFIDAPRRTTTTFEEFTVHHLPRLPFYWPFLNGWLFQRQLRKLFHQLKADIVFGESYTNETAVPKDLPLIYDLADDYAGPADVFNSPPHKIAFKMLGVRSTMRKQCEQALAVTVVSKILEDYAKPFNPNVVILPNGVNSPVVRSVLRTAPATPPPHSLVYATGFGPWSRAVETLEITSELRNEFPDIRLTLIGDGTEVAAMQKYIRENQAESYIDYHGFVGNQTELFRLISQHAIGLNISEKNAWRDASHPMKVMDYSALGIKIVSTDLNEVRRLGYENIFLFGEGKEAFLDAMRKALRAKTGRQDYASITQRVLRDYDWEVITKNLTAIATRGLEQLAQTSVCHVTPSYPPQLGGLEKVVEVLAATEARQGLRTSVITSNQGTTAGTTPGQVPVTRLRSFVFANTTFIPALYWKLVRLPVDSIVHLHITQAFTPEMVWLASKTRGFAYAAHVHLDVPPLGVLGFLLESYKSLLLKQVLRGANRVIVPTDDYKELMIQKYHLAPERIAVIPNGTDHAIVKSAKKAPQGRLKLLFVGRLSPQKNLPLLLQALAHYASTYDKDFHLTIAGNGELREALESQVKEYGLGKQVTFVGSLSGKELEDTYESADIFLLSSFVESFGIVLIEAMTKGLPIVSTDIPAVRNVVQDGTNGILAAQEPQAFAEGVHRIASDKKLYEKMSSNNLKRASAYEWGKITGEFIRTYREMV
ncbi:glycosyltransferase [Candidatus Saccharibacteria bacterium]|nr:MAG: glycosyltransferase [Candidatus Saccharibacteria bacterium]